MDLTGTRAIVTGGGGGLGQRICLALADAGVDIAVTYRQDADRAKAVCDQIRDRGRAAHMAQLDIADADAVAATLPDLASRLGGLDILVNNAGQSRVTLPGEKTPRDLPYGDIEALAPQIWDRLMAINMRGPFLCARAAAPMLKASGRGRIVNVGSTIGFGTRESGLPFAMSKAGAVPLTRYLAATLAPDILVNCVAPGLMEGTGLTRNASDGYVEDWRTRAVLKRTTALDDVAGQVVQFCRADSVTGQTLVIDGGIAFH